jgi:hypothetical protein
MASNLTACFLKQSFKTFINIKIKTYGFTGSLSCTVQTNDN